jgi:hypothetical protein
LYEHHHLKAGKTGAGELVSLLSESAVLERQWKRVLYVHPVKAKEHNGEWYREVEPEG